MLVETLRITLKSAADHVGYGQVYRSWDDDLMATVAVMMCDAHPQLTNVVPFVTEREISARLHRFRGHPIPFVAVERSCFLDLYFRDSTDAVYFRMRWDEDFDFVERDPV